MSTTDSQNYANHTRFDPAFHFFLIPTLLICVLLAIWNLVRTPGLTAILLLLLCIGAALTALKARLYALKVQDRVIRLEERLRMAILLSEPLRARTAELTESQLIALRFASDTELPALVDKTLTNRWASRDIKKAIGQWRPDYFRV